MGCSWNQLACSVGNLIHGITLQVTSILAQAGAMDCTSDHHDWSMLQSVYV